MVDNGGMNMKIEGIGDQSLLNPTGASKSNPGANDINFNDILSDAISQVDDLQKDSEAMNEKLAIGEVDDLHEVVIATEKAELALNLTMEIRNQLVETHDELMRMQI